MAALTFRREIQSLIQASQGSSMGASFSLFCAKDSTMATSQRYASLSFWAGVNASNLKSTHSSKLSSCSSVRVSSSSSFFRAAMLFPILHRTVADKPRQLYVRVG